MKIKEMDIRTDNRLGNSDTEVRQTKRMSKLNFDPRRAGEDAVTPSAIGSFLTEPNITAIRHFYGAVLPDWFPVFEAATTNAYINCQDNYC